MNARTYFRIAAAGIVVALMIGLLSAGQLVVTSMGERGSYTFPHALIMSTPYWLFWAPLFPLILWLVKRFPLEKGCARVNVRVHVLAGFFLSLFHFGFRLWFMHVIGHGYPSGHSYLVHFQEAARFRLWMHFTGYLILLGIAVTHDYYRKYRERELLASQLTAQLSQARLQALRMQLHPHFLFNALNSIAMLARRNDNARAVRMLAGLGDLLRYVLEEARADEVPLRDEMDFLARYLDIEKVRFQDRLVVHLDLAEEALDAFVPNLLLQPVVENAIRHGVARKVGIGHIEIAARRLGDRLVVQVRDDGPGLSGAVDTPGVGLKNLRARLKQLYGEQFSCELRGGDAGGAVASISVPFHTHPVVTGVSAA